MVLSTGTSGRLLLVSAGAAAAAALFAAGVTQAQPPPAPLDAARFAPAAVEMRTNEWRAAVRTHASGQFDDVAASVARWSPDLTRVVVDSVIRDGRERLADRSAASRESDRNEARTSLARGLLLHTDIAIAERTTVTTTAAGRHALRLLDAKPVPTLRFSIHWGLARLIADTLARDPATAAIAVRWYRAVGALYQQWADLGQLLAHLDAGSDALPDDPVLVLYRGSLHQAHADPRVQAFLQPLRAPGAYAINRVAQVLPIEDAATELGTAERYLRRALALDPSLVEARIRLAHVLYARGRPNDALVQARQALASPLPGFLDYYGAMVLGRIEARGGHRAEARAAFERAAARYPRSQAAQVALSQVALTDGRSAGGRSADGVSALIAMLGPGTATVVDPWSQYFRVHEPDAPQRLDEFRRSLP